MCSMSQHIGRVSCDRDLVRLAPVCQQTENVGSGHRSQNNWTLGAYCAQYCRFVTGHHGLEDRSVFPHLRRSEPALTPVLDRLEQEHLVIHDVLEQLDEALVGLVSGASGTAELRRVVDRLSETLLAHLSFEEDELVAPLDRHGFA